MDFGLFNTWNAVYEGGKVPWDPAYSGGKLLEAERLKLNGELQFSRRNDDHTGVPLQAIALANTTTGRLIWSNFITAPASS